MKNILFISLFILGLWACSDNDTIVHIDLEPAQAFTIKPIPGGAIMHHTLPADPEIVGIEVRYHDVFGQEITRRSGTSCDSIQLIGFNEEKTGIPAQVTICFYDNRKSQNFDVTFNTKDSGPVTFMKSVEVYPNWDGFTIKYNNPTTTTGMAHVFYLGIDPVSQLPDTILVNSFVLEETDGIESVNYKMKQTIQDPTIVIRVEDFRGYMVNEKVWPTVKSLHAGLLNPAEFTFFCDRSVEHEKHKLGAKYLFDGDKKGEILEQLENRKKCCSFAAGPNSAGEEAVPMYLDLKKNRPIAFFRIYNLFNYEYSPSWEDRSEPGGMNLIYLDNSNEIPCEVTLYGLKDDHQTSTTFEVIDKMENWVKLGTFKQNKDLPMKQRWCKSAQGTYPKRTISEIRTMDEEYLEIIIPSVDQEEGYRYVKIVINEVFRHPSLQPGQGNINNHNPYNYVQFHELEIYTEKSE